MSHTKKIPQSTIKRFYALGTIITLQIFGENAELALKEAVQKIYVLQEQMSVFVEHSEITNINQQAGKSAQPVSATTYQVINKAIEFSKLTAGVFDPTIRPVVDLWGFGTGNNRLPSMQEIKQKLQLVNFQDIELNELHKTVRLKQSKQKLDLGGIAKGYVADQVKQVLLENEIASGVIDLGGNVYVLGHRPDQSLWTVGIQNPFGLRGESVGTITLADQSVVTSGNYERYFINSGQKYHHIIDPRTGMPCKNELLSVTVISKCSIDADALSTCAYIMGPEQGFDFLQARSDINAIFITKDKQILTTPGLTDNFKLTDQAFKLKVS